MMTRVYGLAFTNKEELKAYEAMMEEAKKRDHRVLGKQLELFSFDDEV
jgi:threonyl-tRNA synthetase